MEKILITGSNGKIGRDIKEILSKYYEIIELRREDIFAEESFENLKAILHFAALTPGKGKDFSFQDYLKVNVDLTKKILFYAVKHHVPTIIIPTSWSWVFRAGPYQYSKLLQEKIALEYKKLGQRIILLELPEVIHKDYKGIIFSLEEEIKQGREKTVDVVNLRIITTKDLAKVCKEYIEKKDGQATVLYKKAVKTINLYEHIEKTLEKESPDKIKYLKKGEIKIRIPLVKRDRTIIFPEFEFQ